jgi:DNA-binding YbaB/EbfC family protein
VNLNKGAEVHMQRARMIISLCLECKEDVMSKKMLGDLMKQAQKMQQEMGKIQEESKKKTVEASAGGGMVVAVANGAMEVVSVKIEKDVVNPDDIEMLQDLVVAAVNEALRRAQQMVNEDMSKITGGMNIPGMGNMFG